MTESVEPIIDYALKKLGFEKLVFTNAVGHPRLGHVKEKTGAKLVGRAPAQFVDPTLTESKI
jgi:RimJ/RimL family protein N-acetyltransferase